MEPIRTPNFSSKDILFVLNSPAKSCTADSAAPLAAWSPTGDISMAVPSVRFSLTSFLTTPMARSWSDLNTELDNHVLRNVPGTPNRRQPPRVCAHTGTPEMETRID